MPFQDVTPLMSPQACVIGGFNRRDWVIPVISLETYVSNANTCRQHDIIVILSFVDSLIGIAIDEVVGMFDIDVHTIGRFTSHSEQSVFSGSFCYQLTQSTVTMLNHEMLFADSALPFVTTPDTTALHPEHLSKDTLQPQIFKLIKIGERMLAFNAKSIFSSLNITNVETSTCSSPCYLGETAHLGKLISVLDLACLIFGQPSEIAPQQRPTVFININEHQIGFSVDCIIEVVEVDSQQAIKKPEQTFSGHSWFSTLYPVSAVCNQNAGAEVEQSPPLIMEVDIDYLANNEAIQGVMGLCRSDKQKISENQLICNSEQNPAIHYDMGTEILSDLSDIVEITPADTPIIPVSDNGYLCGMILLHNKSVAVYDFRSLFSVNNSDYHTKTKINQDKLERILVLKNDNDTFGIRVNCLLDIVSYSIPSDAQCTAPDLPEEEAESVLLTVSFNQNEKKRYAKLVSPEYLKQHFNG